MPIPSTAPYWPSSTPGDGDPFTLWYLTGGVGGDTRSVTASVPDRPTGNLTWYGPYALDGSLVLGAIGHFINPRVYSGEGTFFVLPDAFLAPSKAGFGVGFKRPADFDGTFYNHTDYRRVQNIGLPVETDGFGNQGIILPIQGQVNQMSHLPALSVGDSPPSLGGLGSLEIAYNGVILWSLGFSAGNVKIDALSGPFNTDVSHDVTTTTYTDIISGGVVVGQSSVSTVAHTDDYSTGLMAYTGHVVVPVPGSFIQPVRTRYNDLGDAFMVGKGIVPSTIFPALVQPPGSDPQITCQGKDSFTEFSSGGQMESYSILINFEDGPTVNVPSDAPEFAPVIAAFPNWCAVGPPDYLWFLDYF